jgi:hypothetical protein
VISSAFFILVSACSNKSNNIWSSSAPLAGIIYYIESAVNFKEKYNDSGFTTEVVTDYPEKLAMLDEANKSILLP